MFGMASPSSSAPSATTGAPPRPQPPGAVPLAMPVLPQPKGKDTLMEALMDLDDDGLDDDDEGEVVFGGEDDGSSEGGPSGGGGGMRRRRVRRGRDVEGTADASE